MMTMNSVGRMQKISGKRILTGTFCACSSARWLRLIRISLAWIRSTLAIGMPNASACTMRRDEASRSSARSVRSPRARIASVAAEPDLHLLEDPEELLGEGPLVSAGDLGQRGVEREAGLDLDGQQVERVGQLAPHLLARL